MLELSQGEFQTLTAFVKVNYGLDLSAKKTFVQLRIQKLMAEAKFTSFKAYFQHVTGDLTGLSISHMINGLTVNYTLFHRESLHFDFVANVVLPALYQKMKATRDLRIWSAGCATGEEPYTLAIIIDSSLGSQKPLWDTKILATDISTFALKKAMIGAYPAVSVQGLNQEWLKKYFVKDETDSEFVRIAPLIRDEVIFRRQNLVKDPFVFKQKLHFIFCRNVMIYFDEQTKNSLLRKFYDCLDDGGYLFIGMSETIDMDQTAFEHVMPSVYRKKEGGRLA